ncbi:hypothetical protein FQR65_LT00720 [Abscondita terminalis]|nr:hypothetical protein FQR65_LT00720 [Abscondita terminalis]
MLGGRIITCFAIAKNWERLKTVPDNEDVASLYGINGIRFYTIFLVVAVHSCMVSFTTYSTNPEFVETMTGDPLNMIFVNGYYCIQTFFLLSGMVLSYFFFKTLQKQKTFKISYIFYAFLIRYVRLTTSVIVVVAFSASWLRHLNRGPLWDKTVGTEFRNCRRNWWANLLYINNYYDIPHMCLLQSWYLAADSQLFFLSLIILIIVSKFKKFLVHILSLCMVIGVIIPGIITYVNSYDIVIRQYPETLYELYANAIEWHAVYVSAHTNIGSYVMGLIAGYIIFKYRGKSIVLQKRYIILWWILVWVLPLSIIFLGIPIYRDSFEYSRLGAAVYVALSKNVFVFGICVGILGITKGIGWLLRDAVLWSPLQILGRLTYCLYLVHPTFIRIKAGRNRVKTYMTPFTFLMDTVENLLLSYALALVLCLFVEMPTSALQKLMMSKGKQHHFITEKMPTATTVKTEDTKI